MPEPVATLDQALTSFAARLAATPVAIACGPVEHSLTLDRVTGRMTAQDHDLEAERVVLAVGGAPPPCLVMIQDAATADAGALWAALAARVPVAPRPGASNGGTMGGSLAQLPGDVLRLLVVTRLARDFASAGTVARAAVARLGLSLLADPFVLSPNLDTRFRQAREFPRWDTGRRAWSDKELVLLHRFFRASPGDSRAQLVGLPVDAVARRTVALFLAGLLDDHRVLSKRDLAVALAPVHPNVAPLVRLLTAEGLLEPLDAGYRTRPSGDPRKTGSKVSRRPRRGAARRG